MPSVFIYSNPDGETSTCRNVMSDIVQAAGASCATATTSAQSGCRRGRVPIRRPELHDVSSLPLHARSRSGTLLLGDLRQGTSGNKHRSSRSLRCRQANTTDQEPGRAQHPRMRAQHPRMWPYARRVRGNGRICSGTHSRTSRPLSSRTVPKTAVKWEILEVCTRSVPSLLVDE